MLSKLFETFRNFFILRVGKLNGNKGSNLVEDSQSPMSKFYKLNTKLLNKKHPEQNKMVGYLYCCSARKNPRNIIQ
jgi:hypothetical protein